MAIDDPYYGMEPANCIPDNCFCEAIRYGEWIRQPANTWSNLFFILIAEIILLIWIGNIHALEPLQC